MFAPPPKALRDWVVVCLDEYAQAHVVEAFVADLVISMNTFGRFGIEGRAREPRILYPRAGDSVDEALELLKELPARPQLALVILPTRDVHTYEAVKLKLESAAGFGAPAR